MPGTGSAEAMRAAAFARLDVVAAGIPRSELGWIALNRLVALAETSQRVVESWLRHRGVRRVPPPAKTPAPRKVKPATLLVVRRTEGFARLDALARPDLANHRLAALAETSVRVVEQWRAARGTVALPSRKLGSSKRGERV